MMELVSTEIGKTRNEMGSDGKNGKISYEYVDFEMVLKFSSEDVENAGKYTSLEFEKFRHGDKYENFQHISDI